MTRLRKIILIMVLASVVALSIALVACGKVHVHAIAERKSDGSGHWEVCSCGKKIGQTRPHVVTEWITDVPASETSAGSRHGKCVACDYNVAETIPQQQHTHDFSGDYLYNDYVHFKRCATCQQIEQSNEHEVAEWTTVKPATETSNGTEKGVCNVCEAQLTRTVPMLGHTHNYSNIYSYDADSHWRKCSGCGSVADFDIHTASGWITDKDATATETGLRHKECVVCEKVLQTETIPQIGTETRTVDLYAINDFHGTVERISTVGGYLKTQKNQNANTVFVNSGDMFQGSMESNSNYGKLLADCMDAIGFDAFTYGNHEFDWGLEKMQTLAATGKTPFLGANIYHWNPSTKTWGDYADELAQKYVIKTLPNGLKVGIIGVIGQDQITSIASNLVQNIGFKNPLPIIKDLATELRGEQNCDVVVVSAHVGAKDLVNDSAEGYAPTTAAGLEDYVDLVFCAHTHQEEIFVVDGLPFVQGGGYGDYVSHVTLSVDSSGAVSCTLTQNVRYSSNWDNLHTVDTLVDNSNAQIEEERNKVVAEFANNMDSRTQIPKLVCRAIANYALNQGHDITLAMTNNARSGISKGNVTYSALYEAIPFDNIVYVANVSGKDILYEAGFSSNSVWRVTGEAIQADKYYNIAVIDYLLFHQNTNRDYNYFPSAFRKGAPEPAELTNSNFDGVYNYRFITRDYLLNNAVDVDDYIYDNQNTNKNLLKQDVTLDFPAEVEINGASAYAETLFINAIQRNTVAVLPVRYRFAA